MINRMHDHECEKCVISFQSYRSRQRFCSKDCRGYSSPSTTDQYSRIDGNLSYYLNRLRYKGNHVEGKDRSNITREHLVQIWERQEGRCAISGIPMTYRAEKGKNFPYNASIDCKISRADGGRYEIDNIQLVCTIVNSLMREFPKKDFTRVCLAVADRFLQPVPPTATMAPHTTSRNLFRIT